MAAGRLYVVEDDQSMTVVRALSQSQAINHVTLGKYKVRVASADDVAEYMAQGGTLEQTDAVKAINGVDEPEPEPEPA